MSVLIYDQGVASFVTDEIATSLIDRGMIFICDHDHTFEVDTPPNKIAHIRPGYKWGDIEQYVDDVLGHLLMYYSLPITE